ncbi:efflux RND transporter periplasmic adaptor subunit [Filimonas effusa]|uniref:HlyD family efflux transporter periplasmic adaptor subunit n=1 Tax=Filimonas effusa TaxID=2508721 RepID=A0A4Q1D1Q0_9BACT|nr:efflux RND transporter periplasmic adaptor subunit [Filimonas effusa]RXK81786.1 HlyD family efflux transporter periplasmic adaptor subunit [Filimonas effusa]
MSKKLKWILIILVLLIVLLVVLKKAGVIGKEEGTRVTAEKAAKRDITEVVTASGKIYPEVEVKISSDISGEIVELNVAEGDTVRKGQVLAKIYADIYASQRDQAAAVVAQNEAQVSNARAQLAGLKATLDQTEAAYKRQKTLVEQKVISASEFEQATQAYYAAQANYKAAQDNINANQASVKGAVANLTRANKDISRTTIVAPMDGVISLLLVKKGERVVGTAQMTGTEMMRVADLNSIEVQVDVSESDIPKVKIGDSAIVEVDAYNNRKFKGRVYKIANPSTAATTSSSNASTTITNYQVHIRLFPDSYRDLLAKGHAFPFRPNMTGSADIQTSTHAGVLSVPLNAVTTRDKNDAKEGDNKKSDKKKEEEKKDATADNQPKTGNDGDDLQEVVFVRQPDGKVKKVVVTTGIQDINNIEIKSGLNGGEEVITGPYDVVSKQLKDGTLVKVVSKDELTKNFKKN